MGRGLFFCEPTIPGKLASAVRRLALLSPPFFFLVFLSSFLGCRITIGGGEKRKRWGERRHGVYKEVSTRWFFLSFRFRRFRYFFTLIFYSRVFFFFRFGHELSFDVGRWDGNVVESVVLEAEDWNNVYEDG